MVIRRKDGSDEQIIWQLTDTWNQEQIWRRGRVEVTRSEIDEEHDFEVKIYRKTFDKSRPLLKTAPHYQSYTISAALYYKLHTN